MYILVLSIVFFVLITFWIATKKEIKHLKNNAFCDRCSKRVECKKNREPPCQRLKNWLVDH